MYRLDNAGAAACGRASRALQAVLVAFFALAAASLVVIYLLAPALFVETLFETPDPARVRSAPLTIFLLLVLGFLAVLVVGVARRWRPLWWLLLLAFTASALEIPAIALELAGVLPLAVPAWYALLRMLVSAGLVGIAVWMWRVQRACGAWGMSVARPSGSS
jgi:hypothetical protein